MFMEKASSAFEPLVAAAAQLSCIINSPLAHKTPHRGLAWLAHIMAPRWPLEKVCTAWAKIVSQFYTSKEILRFDFNYYVIRI